MNPEMELLYGMLLSVLPKRRLKKVYGRHQSGPIVRICPGKRHAWIQCSAGLIRKPI